MPQINLLKQQSPGESFLKLLPSLLVKLFVVLVLVLLGYYAWLFIRIGKLESDIKTSEANYAETLKKVVTTKNRNEVYTRQLQLKQFKTLLSGHIYWTNFFPALGQVTLKSAYFSNITASKEGELTLTVHVPDLENIDQFMQIFNQPDFNKTFNALKIGDFRLVQTDQSRDFTFEAHLKFSPAILGYQPETGKP